MERPSDKIPVPQSSDPHAGLSEDHYRELFYNNPLPMWIYDPLSLQFLDVNNSAIEKYGYSREEFLQLILTDIRTGTDKEKLLSAIKGRKESGYNNGGIWEHRTRHGQLLNVEITSHPLEYNNRKAVLVLANDVTEKIEATRLLEKAHQSNIIVLESIMDGFLTVDKEWRVTYWNKEAERMSGTYTRKLFP
jgi:PAS domain S-box-containing protein